MTVTWNPNGSHGRVEIQVISAIDNTFNTGDFATCKAPASAGTFTIPGYVMLAPQPATSRPWGSVQGPWWPLPKAPSPQPVLMSASSKRSLTVPASAALH
jgi:hypothetical protein